MVRYALHLNSVASALIVSVLSKYECCATQPFAVHCILVWATSTRVDECLGLSRSRWQGCRPSTHYSVRDPALVGSRSVVAAAGLGLCPSGDDIANLHLGNPNVACAEQNLASAPTGGARSGPEFGR